MPSFLRFRLDENADAQTHARTHNDVLHSITMTQVNSNDEKATTKLS